jgi:hypothetical protein
VAEAEERDRCESEGRSGATAAAAGAAESVTEGGEGSWGGETVEDLFGGNGSGGGASVSSLRNAELQPFSRTRRDARPPLPQSALTPIVRETNPFFTARSERVSVPLIMTKIASGERLGACTEPLSLDDTSESLADTTDEPVHPRADASRPSCNRTE